MNDKENTAGLQKRPILKEVGQMSRSQGLKHIKLVRPLNQLSNVPTIGGNLSPLAIH